MAPTQTAPVPEVEGTEAKAEAVERVEVVKAGVHLRAEIVKREANNV